MDIRSFNLIKDSMLQSDDLPLAEALDMAQWQTVFDDQEIDFGSDEDAIYTPAITLWALISQVFFKGEMRSCKAAVCRIATLWATLGKTVCSTNTGAYCRARSKITWEAVRDICCQIAESAEASFDHQQTELQDNPHEVVAEAQSTPTGGRILLVDGFTITAADTPENQLEFPQNPSQKVGLGFPLVRGVSLISMVTGLAVGRSGTWPLRRQAKWRDVVNVENARPVKTGRHAGCRLLLLYLLVGCGLPANRSFLAASPE